MENEGSLYLRLYLDEDVHKRLAAALRLRNFDAVSAHEIDRLGLDDEKQLELAASLGRALFTFNARDYIQLHLQWLREGRQHAGIIVSDQTVIGVVVRRLLNLLNRVTPEQMRNQLFWLQTFR